MTRVRIGLAALLLALPSLVLAAADPFAEFRIPDHSWRTKWSSLTAHLGQVDASNKVSQAESGSSRATLAGGATWERDSDRLRHRFSLGLSLSGDASHDEESLRRAPAQLPSWVITDDRDASSRRSDWGEQLTGATALRLQPWRIPLGIEVSFDGRAGLSQRSSRQEFRARFADSLTRLSSSGDSEHESNSESYRAAYSVAFGYGRVRDATAIYLARLLIDRLRSDEALMREPTTSDVQRLAQIFYIGADYGVVHDLPSKTFWRDVERILTSGGLIEPEGLDAFSLQHALEPVLVASGRIRHTVGWWVAPAVGQIHDRRVERSEFSSRSAQTYDDTLTFETRSASSSWEQRDDDFTQFGFVAEWHRPCGSRTQFDARSSATFSEKSSFSNGVYLSSAVAEHLLGERWFLWADASHLRQATGDYLNGYWSTGVTSGIRHYLEDRWNLELRVEHSQSRAFGAFRRSSGLTLSLQYDRGALDAPGLIDPVRPLN